MKSTFRIKILLPLAAALLLAAPSAQADNVGTGGTITYTDASGANPRSSPAYPGGYVIHKFTGSGTFNVPEAVGADVLVLAGGGGGGSFSGGGGAGGLIYRNAFFVTGGINYTVTVGAGGSGGTHGGTSGGSGGNSVFGSLSALGGGGGGSRNISGSPLVGNNGVAGGSGGGASASDSTATLGGAGTAGQGNAGGNGRSPGVSTSWGGGGGGGAGAVGANATGFGNGSASGGAGGIGLPYSITGSSVYYAGGGGGGTYQTGGTAALGGLGGGGAGSKTSNGTSGTANTGGGGGGSNYNFTGGTGGSGIVIVRYPYLSGPDVTLPTVVTFSPADNATNVATGANLVVTFSDAISIGTGNIILKNLTDATDTTLAITAGSPQITVAGAVLTINPAADLTLGKNYAIQIAGTAIKDASGNYFAGIADNTTWNFTASISQVFSTTELAYAGDVSSSDLLTGKTATTTGWNLGNGSTLPELNDGIHGRTFVDAGNSVEGTWTTNGATAIYNLGTSSTGYTLTSIQTIAAWNGAGFGNQAYTVDIKLKGAGSYVNLATVSYQPLGTAALGATKVTMIDPSGFLATGVEFIRFTANSVNGGANGGAFVFREIDVSGSPTSDGIPPTIATLSPADDSTAVLPSSNLTATFSENIAIGAGTITIKNLDTFSDTVITLPDARVSVSGTALTINPDTNLAASTHYAVQMDSTAIVDLSGMSFAGIADDTAWDFTTGVPDLTAPTLVTLVPADNTTNVPIASNLVATFSENIAIGSGSITIRNLDAVSDTVITLPDARVTVSGAALTINPSSDLAATTDYSVQIASGAITDLAGNSFPGIANDTTWNFTTAAAPLRIMCLGDSITTGYTNNPTWTHDFKFGYRSGLYTLLTNVGYNFVFVGGSAEPWNNAYGDPTRGGTYTPTLDLRTFGQDGHRGYGGTTASGLQGNIVSYLNSDNPDIILLKIGTNNQDQTALNTLVNTITTTKPAARLIIAQIMPKYSYQSGIVTYNSYIRDTLVPAQQALGRNVTVVDQYAPFLTNPTDLTTIDQSLFSNGINHPSNPGYDKMAQVWFNGIDALGLGPDTTPPVWASAWPKADTNGTTISTGFTVRAKTDSTGTAYFVVLASGATAPSSAQVKAGNDATGAPALKSGSLALTASTEATGSVTGLTATTPYDVWFVTQDAIPNLQASPFKVSVTTLAPYNAWLAANSETDSPENLKEYAFGTSNTGVLVLNPNGTIQARGQGPILQTTEGSPDVKLVYARLKNSGCTYTAEFSANLSIWRQSNDPALIYPPNTPTEVVVDNGDGMEVVSIGFPLFENIGGGNFKKMEQSFCRVGVATP